MTPLDFLSKFFSDGKPTDDDSVVVLTLDDINIEVESVEYYRGRVQLKAQVVSKESYDERNDVIDNLENRISELEDMIVDLRECLSSNDD